MVDGGAIAHYYPARGGESISPRMMRGLPVSVIKCRLNSVWFGGERAENIGTSLRGNIRVCQDSPSVGSLRYC